MNDFSCDCLVVGGGPAGLTAAIYLGRFYRRTIVVDKAEGRLALIPLSRNHAGHPQGVSGPALLADMQAQARQFGAVLVAGEVTSLRRDGTTFQAQTDAGPITARTVLLATGVMNLRPPVAQDVHDDAVARGLLRYCPICDGYEQTGKHIGVLGGDRHALAEALFLRRYSDAITLLTLSRMDLNRDERGQAERAGIVVEATPVSAFDFSGDVAAFRLNDGRDVQADTLYAALGSHTRNDLGTMLGTDLVAGECFVTDEHRRTTVPGVYAAGDAVEGLDQISVAMGTAARAAVAIHNDLRDIDGDVLHG